jgi:hypothetical protein
MLEPSILRRAKLENLLRLARAMGLGDLSRFPLHAVVARIHARSIGLQVEDDFRKLRERKSHV